MRLWIAEKPSLARAIADALPGSQRKAKGYIEVGSDIVTWCFGHMYEQAQPPAYGEKYAKWVLADLPIVPPNDGWKLIPRKDAREQLDTIESLLKKATEVVNAGDPDREGQMLVDELLEELECRKPTKRIWLGAGLDDVSMKRAIASMKSNADPEYKNLYAAAVCRSRADWLYISLSRHATLTARNSRPSDYQDVILSVGRVQTPTLALVVERDLLIENFKPTDHFGVKAMIAHQNGTFEATWKMPEATEGLDPENRLIDRTIAEKIAAKVHGQQGSIAKYDVSEKQEKPPLLYSLSQLQLVASRKFGMGAQKVLDTAQALYEAKLTSYPRTDCRYINEEQHGEAKEILRAVAGNYGAVSELCAGANPSLKSDVWNDKKLTAHHAIVPKATRADISRLNDAERKLYDLIVRSYLAQFYPPYRFSSISVSAAVAGETFTASGAVPLAQGWKVVEGKASSTDRDDEDEAEATQAIPKMAKGDPALAKSARVNAMVTKPPSRYTEGTLIQAMAEVHKYVADPRLKALLKENAGIGTEATRANIIETLFKRQFLETRGKQIFSTAVARGFILTLKSVMPDVVSAGLTGLVEQKLEEIANGAYPAEEFMQKQVAWVTRLIDKSKGAAFPPVPEALRGKPRGAGGPARKGGAGGGGSFKGRSKGGASRPKGRAKK